MADVGAASKRNEVYGIPRLELGGLRVPFPGNLLFFKYLPPIKRWGPYRELGGRDWGGVLDWLERHGSRPTPGVAPGWGGGDGPSTPAPPHVSPAGPAVGPG